ncbi:MAG: hypothetical protein GTO40_26450 [Deltaproteobacteria bacterium]|nr:hypothetical protein [Deltaproteobacteria bacterium]
MSDLNESEKEFKRILLVLHGSIGDVARALPLANLIRRSYPRAKVTWSIEPLARPVVENHPAVDEVMVFERQHWWRAVLPFLLKIHACKFDLVLDLQRHLKSGLISWWSRAPVRVGFHRLDSKEGNWLFNNRHLAPMGDQLPKLSHYLKFAEFLGIPDSPIEWNLSITPQEAENLDLRLRTVENPFAVFFVGASWESKRWFPYQSAVSVQEIHRRYGLSVVLLGGREDVPFALEMESHGLGPVVNWVGRCSLRESMGILARAKVAVGVDTGLMHLSEAVGTPVVSLWGATNPVRTGPFLYGDLIIRGKSDCSPCYLRKCPIGRVCMQSINVEEVVAKVGEALALGDRRNQAGGID